MSHKPSEVVQRIREQGTVLASDQDLLQVLGGCRNPPTTQLEDLRGLSIQELEQQGWPPSGAARLAAAFELGRRLLAVPQTPGGSLHNPETAIQLLHPYFRGAETEHFYVVTLTQRFKPLGVHRVSEGCLTETLVHPREVFCHAVRARAAAILVAHNHPSGDPTPSAEDRALTDRLQSTGKLLGIQLLDHLILGGADYVSLQQTGALPG